VKQVRALTNGKGVDFSFEFVGHPTTYRQTYEMARQCGTVVVVGTAPVDSEIVLPGRPFFVGEKRFTSSVYGSTNVRRDFPRFARLAERGLLDLAGLVSQVISLDGVSGAFDAMERGEVLRSVVRM
jgi:S-(hydroxymethyl)glutathione dehydrogenase / alcohol dehydrogenase